MRYPSVTITSLVAQLLSYPLGCLLANALPIKSFRIFGRWTCVLNPDHHFNIKEHAVITIMSNLSFGSSWVGRLVFVGNWDRYTDISAGNRHYPSSEGILRTWYTGSLSDFACIDNATIRAWSSRSGLQVYCGTTSNGKKSSATCSAMYSYFTDMARHVSQRRSIRNTSQQSQPRSWWLEDLSLQILLVHLLWWFCLVLVSWIHFHCS